MSISKKIVLTSLVFLALSGATFAYARQHHFILFSDPQVMLNSEAKVPAISKVLEMKSPGSLRVPIFIYHSVRPPYEGETADVKRYTISPENLDAQLQSLHDAGYVVIPLDTLVNAINGGTSIPPKSAVLTFDDGWENEFIYGLPVLEKHHDTATFFVYTHALGHRNFMTWDDLKALDEAGMTIGDHTETHPMLYQITDETVMKNEIERSTKALESFLHKPITNFAYPFGRQSDLATKILKEAGFQSARTTYTGMLHSKADLLTLTGYLVEDTPHFASDIISQPY